MTPYIVNLTILYVGSFVSISKSNKKLKRIYLWLTFLILLLFAGARGYNVGYDYLRYEELFNNIQYIFFIEPLFGLLLKVFNEYSNFYVFLFFIASVSLLIKFKFFRQYSYYPLFSILVFYTSFYLINEMGQIRYGLALSFVSLYYSSLFRERKAQKYIYLFLAIITHYSSAIVIPTLLFFKYRFKQIEIFWILVVCFVFYIININTILLYLSTLLPIGYLGHKILVTALDVEGYGRSVGLNLSIIIRWVILFSTYYCLSKSRTKDQNYINILFNLYFFGVVLYMILNSNAEFAIRGSGYFKFLEVLIFPLFIKTAKSNFSKLLVWFLTSAYCIFSFYKLLLDPDLGEPFIPYSSLLESI